MTSSASRPYPFRPFWILYASISIFLIWMITQYDHLISKGPVRRNDYFDSIFDFLVFTWPIFIYMIVAFREKRGQPLLDRWSLFSLPPHLDERERQILHRSVGFSYTVLILLLLLVICFAEHLVATISLWIGFVLALSVTIQNFIAWKNWKT